MRRSKKPRSRKGASSKQKMTRRAILAALGAGVATRSLGADASDKPAEDIPVWVTALSRCTGKYLSGWSAEKEFRELKVLRLRLDDLGKNTLTVARDAGTTPVPVVTGAPPAKS
jgi:hypothetical protein